MGSRRRRRRKRKYREPVFVHLDGWGDVRTYTFSHTLL